MAKLHIYLSIVLVFKVILIIECSKFGSIQSKIKKYNLYIDNNIQTIQDAFNDSYNAAKNIANNLRSNAVDTEEQTLFLLKEVFNDFDAQINTLKQTRVTTNVDRFNLIADSCKRDIFEVLMSSSSCLTEKLDEASSYIDNLHFIYENMMEESVLLKKQLEDCKLLKNEKKSLLCVENLVQTLPNIKANNLIAEIEKTNDKIKLIEGDMNSCSMQSSIDSIKEKIPIMISNIEDCMQKL